MPQPTRTEDEERQIRIDQGMSSNEDFDCKCGGRLNILHTSNWHDGTGIYYTECDSCKIEINVRWKSKDK